MQKVLTFLLFTAFLGSSCVYTEAKIEAEKVDLKKISIESKDKENFSLFDAKKLSPQGQKAYEHLLKAERFEQGAVGYAGTVSRYIESFNLLLKEEAADEAFKGLLNEATTAGKLYALCGLYFTDYETFQKETENLAKSAESVETMSGCLISSEKVANLVEAKSQKVAIIKPSQTIEDFWKTNPGSYELDIAHGGFPATFKRFANAKKQND